MSNQSKAIEIKEFRSFMRRDDIIERFADMLGAERARSYVNSVILVVANKPELQVCEPLSILSAALQAASLRLSVDPVLRQAALVPFKGKAVFIPMYKGLQDMAMRTGKYRYINTNYLVEGQEFVEDAITGAARIEGRATGTKKIGWLAHFTLNDGFSKTIYWTVEEIHAHAKQYSKSYTYKDAPWTTNKEDMERKTVLRQLLTKWAYMDPNDAAILQELEDRPFMDPDDETYVSGLVLDETADEPAERKDADTLIGELTGEAPKPPTVKKVAREDAAQAELLPTEDVPLITEERLDMLAKAKLGSTDKEKIAGALARSAILEGGHTDRHFMFWFSNYCVGRKDNLDEDAAADKADSLLVDLLEDEKSNYSQRSLRWKRNI